MEVVCHDLGNVEVVCHDLGASSGRLDGGVWIWRNSSWPMVPLYFSGKPGRNLVGQLTRLKSVVKA